MIPLRFKAALLHLLATVVVAGLASALVVALWFPGDYRSVMGGTQLLLLIIGCDIVLGPLMSLVVCDPVKPRRTLLMDYAVIIAIQGAALVYGLGVVAESRPAFTVFAIDRFNVVAAFEVERGDLAGEGGSAPYTVSWTGPQYVTLKLPEDAQGRNAALDLEMKGQELQALPRYYVDYDAAAALARAQTLASLQERHPQARASAARLLQAASLGEDDVAWLPISTRFGFDTALVARRDGVILGFLGFDPY
jgi:hypothetical protein